MWLEMAIYVCYLLFRFSHSAGWIDLSLVDAVTVVRMIVPDFVVLVTSLYHGYMFHKVPETSSSAILPPDSLCCVIFSPITSKYFLPTRSNFEIYRSLSFPRPLIADCASWARDICRRTSIPPTTTLASPTRYSCSSFCRV